MAPVRARAEAVGAPRGDGPPPGEAHADHQTRGTARDAAQVVALHHDIGKMQKYNFNITFPIMDALHGTTHGGDD